MKKMKCRICGRKAKKNSIVCSDECQDIRLKMRELDKKYFPTNGCDNCWSDAHVGCTTKCKEEFRKSREFIQDMWSLVKLLNKTWEKTNE